MNKLEKAIGYSFKNKSFLDLALTHSSFVNDKKLEHTSNNERLEFLGDAVLELVISELVYNKYQDLPEGELTRLRASVVCEQALADAARKIDLAKYLKLGKGEIQSKGYERDSILADSFEAFIGAIYLDSNLEAARKFILKYLQEELSLGRESFSEFDPKTFLQEEIQKDSKNILTYHIINESGPDHDKHFEAEVRLNGSAIGSGLGRTKKRQSNKPRHLQF